MNQLESRKTEIAEKQATLTKAKQTLKEEFVGINRVIDEVVDAIGSWYLFPEIQEKPLIINLWGLTGVGKTSLVKRLSSLVGFEKQFYHFDLSEEKKRSSEIKDEMESIFENEGGYPVILAFDEFQHARTIDANGIELADSCHRIVWQLLDTGRFTVQKILIRIFELYQLTDRLNRYILAGVIVRDGMVRERIDTYRQMRGELLGTVHEKEAVENRVDELQFIPNYFFEKIYDLAPGLFESQIDTKRRFLELNGHETLKLLQAVIKEAHAPKEVDCSKGLIFILGNLDEAYHMSGNQNADISADDFHEESLKINVPKIKKALKRRFRNEHIARLGNHHIIYPALNRSSFQQIIKWELDKIAKKTNEHFALELHFHPSLHDLLYAEGVYPTQGTRPLLTTIYQMVHARIGDVVSELYRLELDNCTVQFEAHTKGILIRFIRGEETCHTLIFEQEFELSKLRKEKKDDQQAITAVHESGHAVLAAVLLHTVPKLVCSVTTETDSNGFAQISHAWEYTSKREIIPRMAMLLGGLIAEKIIFGDEYVTDGNSSDMRRATLLATNAIKEEGQGNFMGNFTVEMQAHNFGIFDNDYQLNDEARRMLSEAAHLAEETLRQQETLLLHMANYLSDHRQLHQPEIIEMLQTHAVNFNAESLITNGDHLYYREHLKQKMQKHRTPNELHQDLTEGMILNGKKQTAH